MTRIREKVICTIWFTCSSRVFEEKLAEWKKEVGCTTASESRYFKLDKFGRLQSLTKSKKPPETAPVERRLWERVMSQKERIDTIQAKINTTDR